MLLGSSLLFITMGGAFFFRAALLFITGPAFIQSDANLLAAGFRRKNGKLKLDHKKLCCQQHVLGAVNKLRYSTHPFQCACLSLISRLRFNT